MGRLLQFPDQWMALELFCLEHGLTFEEGHKLWIDSLNEDGQGAEADMGS